MAGLGVKSWDPHPPLRGTLSQREGDLELIFSHWERVPRSGG